MSIQETPVRSIIKVCSDCNGKGRKPITSEEFESLLLVLNQNTIARISQGQINKEKAFDILSDYIVDYSEDGSVECPDCEGAGTWVEFV